MTPLGSRRDTVVSVAIPAWIWLAALSVEGGRVMAGLAAAAEFRT
jgi:hypothetical protein